MMSTYHPKPSLDDAFARVDRAKEHLTRLKAEIDTVIRGSIIIGAGVTGTIQMDGDGLPKSVSILIGEIVYNLRAALDYLMFQLAYLDSGTAQKDTKFLIEDHKNGWQAHLVAPSTGGCKRSRRKLWLSLLTNGHQATIERLQPFAGCGWTKRLRELSNPDKHHALVIGSAGVTARVTANPSSKDLTAGDIIDRTVDVQGEVTAIVAFDDGAPVIETLEILQTEVAAVLAGFDADFG